MQQVSQPLRIVLVAVLALGALWLVVLRPKEVAEPAIEPPPVAAGGLASDVQQARRAKEVADAAAARSQAAAGQADKRRATPRAASGAGTAEKASERGTRRRARLGAGPSRSLIAALDRGRTVVLVFRNGSADSSAVVAAARSRARASRVVVRVASIADVGRYAVFTRSASVSQAPTTLVVGPSRRARVIVGFTTAGEIAQAVGDVRRRAAR